MGCGSVWAQAPGSSTGAGIDAREANQQRRIEQGIKSGPLTPGRRLERRVWRDQISFMSRPRRDSIEIPSHIWQRMENALAHAA